MEARYNTTYTYDGLGRIVKRSFYTNPASPEAAFQSEYAHVPGGYGPGSTTALVRSIRQAGGTREYVYDSLGNILRERRQNKGTEAGALSFEGGPVTGGAGEALTLEAASMGASDEITYAYDPLGQLIRVDDEREGATWTYRYDQGGNILEKKRYGYTLAADLDGLTPEQVIPYAYGDTSWKDRLTAYDGKPIACDPIGNPLFYDGWTYTWKAGRMLHRMVRDGVDTLYTLNGKRITHLRKGPIQMHFFYDAQGRPAMVRYNDTDYAYLQNLQGDVTGIVDMNGAVVVEYGYDAWGKPIATIGGMAETLGYDNPFRYRGYVYDEETGLYYLRSRYYDPVWGRFVNGDTVLGSVGALFTHNGFAYCYNNPTTLHDPNGMSPRWSDPKYIAAMEARGRRQMILAHSAAKKRNSNPKAPIITANDLLANLGKLVDKKKDVSSETDTGCGMFIRCGILGKMGRHSHDVYHAGMTSMFKHDLILRGNIEDIGGPDNLVKGMILGTKKGEKVEHGGVYAGLHDFGAGAVPAVYSFNTKLDVGNLRPYTDIDWVYYGWHIGVVLN